MLIVATRLVLGPDRSPGPLGLTARRDTGTSNSKTLTPRDV